MSGGEALNGVLQIWRQRRPLQRPGHQRLPRHQHTRPLAPDLQRRPHLRRLRPARERPAEPDRQLRRLHRRPRRPVAEPGNDDPALRADPRHGADLAGQPQPLSAAAARLRDRTAAGRRRAAGPDRRRRNRGSNRRGRWSRAKRAAAWRNCSPKRRLALPAPPRKARRTRCRSSTGSASARPRS